jgi:hypothetical protein
MADNSNYYDQLVAIRQQAAHQRLVQGLDNQRRADWHDYCQAIQENNMDQAANCEAAFKESTRKWLEETGQVPHQQQQQPQQQFSAVEQQILREFPGLGGDPRKMAEAVAASQALQLRGYDRNSPEYDIALRTAIGLAKADGSDGDEVASADTALEAVNNSQIARRFGPVSANEYNAGVQRLIAGKQSGKRE